MSNTIIEGKTFENIDYSDQRVAVNKFEECTFINCNFNNSDISQITFIDCNFENCDFSLARSKDTALKDVSFRDCKLVGFKFSDSSHFLLSMKFYNCNLSFATFHDLKIPKTTFVQCNLQEVDFSKTNLSSVFFDHCDLQRTIFENTVLEKADFTTAYNYTLDPAINRIEEAIFPKEGLLGLLTKYKIQVK